MRPVGLLALLMDRAGAHFQIFGQGQVSDDRTCAGTTTSLRRNGAHTPGCTYGLSRAVSQTSLAPRNSITASTIGRWVVHDRSEALRPPYLACSSLSRRLVVDESPRVREQTLYQIDLWWSMMLSFIRTDRVQRNHAERYSPSLLLMRAIWYKSHTQVRLRRPTVSHRRLLSCRNYSLDM